MISAKIKILVVDDAAVFRQSVSSALNSDPEIQVIGTAYNGKQALQKIEQLKPDLVTLDVEMPEMDGIETLKNIRAKFPDIGVIMFSIHTETGAQRTIEALALGAFDFVTKPSGQGSFAASIDKIKSELIPLIKNYRDKFSLKSVANKIVTPYVQRPPVNLANKIKAKRDVIAIGVSTGGPNALSDCIPKFPEKIGIPILIVQHMPPIFTKQLADRLNSKSKLTVVEARDNEIIQPDHIYIAPGNYHMEVKDKISEKVISLNQKPPENSCRPAVDVLFRSVAEVYNKKALGVILTGMGKDGFLGSKMMKENGAYIIAQDEESCVVWGMPRFIVEGNLADEISSLNDMTDTILSSI
jgi:two-component system chemotaxis response regulator CheB